VERIVAKTDRDHPYEVPCVIATIMVAGNPAYLQWVRDETLEALVTLLWVPDQRV